ncbi:unnamed protein product [Wuchereria bancrofti]|uniref:Uncharacterized protein n=1 Tax=Wuchereria bancrofti TaxID=6293 RepID=A0A3P7DI45_WUCBA|nr:unnamed protein product [Wuchereria bancrofti]
MIVHPTLDGCIIPQLFPPSSANSSKFKAGVEGSMRQENVGTYPFKNPLHFKMEGMKPAFCGDYFTLELPIYSVKESKSNSIQFLHKLYFQNYRDVYTHGMCNYKCVFGCRRVGYDEEIMSELLIRNVPNLHVYQCDRYLDCCYCLVNVGFYDVHSWVFIAAVIVVFINLLILITCFVRSKISSVHGNTKEVYVD